METTKGVIGVRFPLSVRAEVKAAADRHFEGNESRLVREATRLYLAMRRQFGVQYEPTVSRLLGTSADEQAA